MGDRLVLWSGGGRFVASKDVASAAIVQKLKVNWGNLGTDYLTGTIGTISTTISAFDSTLITGFVSRSDGANYSIYSRPKRKNVVFVSSGDFLPNFSYPNIMYQGFGGSSSCGEPTAIQPPPTDGNRWLIVSFNSSEGLFGVPVSGIFAADTHITHSFSQLQIIDCRIYQKTVTTNTNAISSRTTNQDPVLSTNCAIAITYTDNSTQEISLNYCPTWVEVEEENTCPPETCHQCTHDGETCCYAKKEDGLIHLIDRFHVTS